MKLKPILLVMLSLHGSALIAAEAINWLAEPNISQQDNEMALEHQRVVRVNTRTGTSSGMAFPITPDKVLTAAHVVAGKRVGDQVSISGKLPGKLSFKTIIFKNAIISALWPERDAAEITLTGDPIPISDIPTICGSSPAPGSEVMAVMPGFNQDDAMTGQSQFKGIVTTIETMPSLKPEIDKLNDKDHYPLSKYSGQPRIMVFGTPSPGTSGGALWDVRRHCVAGIVSAQIEGIYLANNAETMRDAGNPPATSLLSAVPINYATELRH